MASTPETDVFRKRYYPASWLNAWSSVLVWVCLLATTVAGFVKSFDHLGFLFLAVPLTYICWWGLSRSRLWCRFEPDALVIRTPFKRQSLDYSALLHAEEGSEFATQGKGLIGLKLVLARDGHERPGGIWLRTTQHERNVLLPYLRDRIRSAHDGSSE